MQVRNLFHMARLLPTGLWRHSDFLKLWSGETISLFGDQVSALALPLTAVLVLEATPRQMGFLNAARFTPFLLIALPAGVWIDRHRRRPVLIASNVGRGLLMGFIPLLAALALLQMSYLYLIVFLAGILTVFFDLAYQSYLPALVTRSRLVNANSKLMASASAAEIGGPGLAGILVELFTAPLTILLDALSFVASALLLFFIRTPEPQPAAVQRRSLRREIGEGLRMTFGNPYLRAIAAEATSYNMAWQVIEAVFVLYATRELGITPGLLGTIIATGSVGALLGSVAAGPLARRLGVGPAIVATMIVACTAPLLMPLAGYFPQTSVPILALAHFTGGIGVAASNVHVISLRQAVTPDRLLGRMNASYRLVIYGTLPLGALLGGFLGELVGLQTALFVGALSMLAAPLWAIFSPVPHLRELPEQAALDKGESKYE